MPRFSYEAYDEKGSRSAGEINAETREAALQALFQQGRYPLQLVEGGRATPPAWWQREVLGPRRLGRSHLALLTRELATLVSADLPVDDVLRIIRLQPTMSARTCQVIGGVLDRVLDGSSLSEALRSQDGAFPEYYWRVIQAGEASGTLARSLKELAALLERTAEFRGRIAAALVYPALLLVMAAIALAVVLTVLVPTIAPMFSEAGREPPLAIRILSGIQQTLSDHWLPMAAIVVAVAGGLAALARNDRWALARDGWLLRLPVFGNLVRNGQVAIMARTLGTMIANGVPMLSALRVTGNALRNRAMAQVVLDCAEAMREGGSLVEALARSGRFPELAIRLISAGEQSAQLETMLTRLAEIYETTLQLQLQRTVALAAPVLTILIGLMVGGLLLAVMGAIVSVNELVLQ